MPTPPEPVPIQRIRLMPVVDFAEYEYGRSDLEFPDIDFGEPGRDAAFAAMWRKQLARRGLGDARGLEGRPELLDPDGLTTAHLQWLLVDHVAEVEADNLTREDEFREPSGDEEPDGPAPPPLEWLKGGVAMLDGEQVLTSPQCCVDFGELDDWNSAAGAEAGATGMLWIGHPWLEYRVDGAQVVITEDTSEGNDEPRCWSTSQEALRLAIREARESLRRLRPRVTPIVQAWFDAHTPAMEPPEPVDETVEFICGHPDDEPPSPNR